MKELPREVEERIERDVFDHEKEFFAMASDELASLLMGSMATVIAVKAERDLLAGLVREQLPDDHRTIAIEDINDMIDDWNRRAREALDSCRFDK